MFNEGYLVVCREPDKTCICGEIEIPTEKDFNLKVKYVEDINKAIATQMAMLIGGAPEICETLIKEEDKQAAIRNLKNTGWDRISNSEGECFIFALKEK